MSGCSTLQQVALYTVELTGLRKVSFPPASSVMWPSPLRYNTEARGQPAAGRGGGRRVRKEIERDD